MDAVTKMLDHHIAAVVKQEEFDIIRRTVRLFGENGSTLPDICGTFQVLYNRELDKSLLRELISNCQVVEIPGTGRVCDFECMPDTMQELVDELYFDKMLLNRKF